MTRFHKTLALIAFSLLTCSTSWAQNASPLAASTGSLKGSYHRFMNETKGVCTNSSLQLTESSGSPQNLDRIEANEAAIAPVQADALALYGNTRDMSHIKVLVPLFQEQVHVVTRASLGKKGGVSFAGVNVGGKEVVLNSVADLNGRTVAAAGGSHITAQVIRLQAQLNMNLVEEKNATAVLNGVLAGTYDAGILVGAQPLGDLVGLGDKLAGLKLLPFPEDVMAKVNKVYAKATPLTYRQMGAGGTSIPTIGMAAVLVTQNYRSGPKAAALVALRDCILNNAEEQASTTGTHPAWRTVGKVQVNWPLYEAAVGATTKK